MDSPLLSPVKGLAQATPHEWGSLALRMLKCLGRMEMTSHLGSSRPSTKRTLASWSYLRRCGTCIQSRTIVTTPPHAASRALPSKYFGRLPLLYCLGLPCSQQPLRWCSHFEASIWWLRASLGAWFQARWGPHHAVLGPDHRIFHAKHVQKKAYEELFRVDLSGSNVEALGALCVDIGIGMCKKQQLRKVIS
jgi:hypothetical protein